MSTEEIRLPKKIAKVFQAPLGELRYRCVKGGRGSGKSASFSTMSLVHAYQKKLRVLCVREFQNSIKESMHAELKGSVERYPWMQNCFNMGIDYLRGNNGSEYLFKGIKNNPQNVKSTSNIDICIIDEAEDLNEESWQILLPTIRNDNSEIWIAWNPKSENSPVNKRFVINTPPRCVIEHVNWRDNPWFPDVLKEQREHEKNVLDTNTYNHIWEGDYLKTSDAQIFKDKHVVDEFEPQSNWDGPYGGLDFGFSADPLAALKVWVHDDQLFIEHECGGHGIELDEMVQCLKDGIPDVKNLVIRADSSRPDTISLLKRKGLPRVMACAKGKGSVEDGITFIKSFKRVVIHPRCLQTINEFILYSYKVDRLTGDISRIPVDAFNHYIDALRYALELIMKARKRDYRKTL